MASINDPYYYCPVCGQILETVLGKEQISKMKCKYCNSEIISTGKNFDDFLKMMHEPRYEEYDEYDLIKILYIQEDSRFDPEKEKQREEKEKIEKEQNWGREVNAYASQVNVPKCPTCGSTSLSRVNGSATGWVGAFGTISMNSNAGKTFCCNNCGYKW